VVRESATPTKEATALTTGFAKPTEHAPEMLLELQRMGIPLDALEGALLDGFRGRGACTGLHPKWFPGSRQHADTVQGIRARLIQEGWTPAEERGLATIVSPDGSFQIAVSSGDANVGTSEPPKTTNPKGSATVSAVETNEKQQNLFALPLPVVLPPGRALEPKGRKTWFLLYNSTPNKIAFELSLPRSVDTDGRPNDWSRRLVFAAIPVGDVLEIGERGDEDVNPTEYVVDVTKK
jgi:hypothetical protein